MKKLFYIPAALLALVVAGCNKAEIDPSDNVDTTAEKYQITASIVDTKTSYDDQGKFSWVANDKIDVVVWSDGSVSGKAAANTIDHWTFTTSDSGTTATFSANNISAPWHELGVALYPSKNMSSKNYLGHAGTYDSGAADQGLKVVLQQEIGPDLANPMSVIPLIGRKNSGTGVYEFSTATGILKVTVDGIPSDAYYLYLQGPSTAHFSGTFAIGDKDTIKSSDYVEGSSTTSNKKTIYFRPESNNETRDFYFPLPEGKIPAGTKLKLDCYNNGWYTALEKEFQSDVVITANHVTPLKAVSTWTSLGTGQFYDDNGFYNTGGSYQHVNVTIEQCDYDPKRYRVVNPYQAYIDDRNVSSSYIPDSPVGPDPYLYFTLKDNYVEFEPYHTGLKYNAGDEFVLRHPKTEGYANYWNNCVTKYDTDGTTPLNVQLAPLYFDVNDVLKADCTQNPKIEIVFPNSTKMLTTNNFANNGTASCAQGEVTATLGSTIQSIKVIAAASFDEGVVALIAGSGDIMNFTVSGTSSFSTLPEGTYYLVYKVESSCGIAYKNGGQFSVSALNPNQIRLFPSMMNVVGTCTHDGQKEPGMLDWSTSTYWHSNWWYAVSGLDPIYGLTIDIALTSAMTQAQFRYMNRNSNTAANHIVIGVSNDGNTWTKVLDTTNDADGNAFNTSQYAVNVLPIVSNGGNSFTHIRFGIVDSTNTDPGSFTDDTQMNFNGYKKCVAFCGFELYSPSI